jgi:hypothetical protein
VTCDVMGGGALDGEGIPARHEVTLQAKESPP